MVFPLQTEGPAAVNPLFRTHLKLGPLLRPPSRPAEPPRHRAAPTTCLDLLEPRPSTHLSLTCPAHHLHPMGSSPQGRPPPCPLEPSLHSHAPPELRWCHPARTPAGECPASQHDRHPPAPLPLRSVLREIPAWGLCTRLPPAQDQPQNVQSPVQNEKDPCPNSIVSRCRPP